METKSFTKVYERLPVEERTRVTVLTNDGEGWSESLRDPDDMRR